jgi:type II secretory ATPase GspE/PulE/Tfp pilus assembly ATPase PilB-like protein
MKPKAGAGCANCGNSGYLGATGIYEVLPFTESVRATIARAGTESEIAAAAQAAGMRPMATSGLAKVEAGRVSPDELNRVLRFWE